MKKITKSKLRELIQEEVQKQSLEEGIFDKIAGKFGASDKKKKCSKLVTAALEYKNSLRPNALKGKSIEANDRRKALKHLETAISNCQCCWDEEENIDDMQRRLEKFKELTYKFSARYADDQAELRADAERSAAERAAAPKEPPSAAARRAARLRGDAPECRNDSDCPGTWDDCVRGKCRENRRASMGLEEGSKNKQLTKTKLKQVIQEELAKILKEN